MTPSGSMVSRMKSPRRPQNALPFIEDGREAIELFGLD